jgi:hypothetical protein
MALPPVFGEADQMGCAARTSALDIATNGACPGSPMNSQDGCHAS